MNLESIPFLLASLVINLLIFVVSAFVAYFSYKAHKLTNSIDFGYLSVGLLALSASFAVKSFSIFVYLLDASKVIGTLTFHSYVASVLLYRFFFIFGIVLILLATKELKPGWKGEFAIYLFISIILITLTSNLLFKLVTIILLLIIVSHYYMCLLKYKTRLSRNLFFAMLLLFLGQFIMIFFVTDICIYQCLLFLFSFILLFITILSIFRIRIRR